MEETQDLRTTAHSNSGVTQTGHTAPMQKEEDTTMAVTDTETSWLSPELQRAAVAALQILKGASSEGQRNTLLDIVGFRQGKERGDGDVYVDTRRALITDSCGSYIYPEDWAEISYAHIAVASLLSNAVRDVLWDLHEQLLL